MPHWCQGKAEALKSCFILATVGLELVQKWSLMYFFSIQKHWWFKKSRIHIPWDYKWAAARSWESDHCRAFYLTQMRFISLSCYQGCNKKGEFKGYNSSPSKAAILSRLSETPSELGDRSSTQPWQEQGSRSIVLSWEAASLICNAAIPEQLHSLEDQHLFAAKPAQPISS